MNDEDGYFDERVAASYDESAADDVRPVGRRPGRRLPRGARRERTGARARDRDRADRAPARAARRAGARDRAVEGDGRDGCARSRAAKHIGVTIGDFATTTVDGSFSLAYLVFNTIMNLTTQAAQVACFRNVAAHLEPGGRFVVEVMVPELRRLPPGETFHVFDGEERPLGDRRVRRREPGAGLPSPGGRGRHARALLDALPVRVARGARPDGAARRDDAARTLERVEARAVHERQPQARLGLGEAARSA